MTEPCSQTAAPLKLRTSRSFSDTCSATAVLCTHPKEEPTDQGGDTEERAKGSAILKDGQPLSWENRLQGRTNLRLSATSVGCVTRSVDEKQMITITCAPRLRRILFSAVVLAQLTSVVLAQSGTVAPPMTYDYDPAVAGTQGPKSPLLAGYSYRSVRSYQVAVPVIVPLADLQAILAKGYTALPTVAGSTFSALTLNLIFDQRFQPAADSSTTYGPTSALLVTATVLNSNFATPRQEIIFPCFEASSDVDKLNGTFGVDAARLAEVKASAVEEKGILKFSFAVTDSAIGMALTVEAQAPDTINTRVVSDPVGLPFRSFNGLVPSNSFWATSQSDNLAVPVAAAKVKIHSPGHRLYFPAGALSIIDIGPTVTFSRGVEFFIRFE